jgi:hypothetical protein
MDMVGLPQAPQEESRITRWFRNPLLVGLTILATVAGAFQVAGVVSMTLAVVILALGVWVFVTAEVWCSKWLNKTGRYAGACVLLASGISGCAAVGVAVIISDLKQQQSQPPRAMPNPSPEQSAKSESALQSLRSDKDSRPLIDDPQIQFTSSLWTDHRKAYVINQIQTFNEYLFAHMRKAGIEPPSRFPLFSAVATKQYAFSTSGPPNPPLDGRHIPVSTQALIPIWIRRNYADFVFDAVLRIDTWPPGDPRLSWMFADYFVHSSLDFPATATPTYRTARNVNRWHDVLWTMRVKFGKEFVDRALMYGVRYERELRERAIKENSQTHLDGPDNLNEHTRDLIWHGIEVIGNESEMIIEVNKILDAHGLLR